MKKLFTATIFIFVFYTFNSFSQPKIIFDTDIGGDADDLGALAMLHNYVKRGDCELLAIMLWTTDEFAVPAVDAINRFYLNPNVPIGSRKDGTYRSKDNYNQIIADNFEYKLTYSDVPEVVGLYRKILASAADTSITIVTVGPLLNIQRLIQSGADKHSTLSGSEMISKKVKEFVIMGGQFPKGENEWNFNGNMPGVTKFVLENLKVPIVFSGYELGVKIKTGATFNNIDPETPLYKGFLYFSEHAPWMKDQFKGKILNNSTFDQTAVLYAVNGGVDVLWEKVTGGYCEAGDNGGNRWVKRKNSSHSYLKLIETPEFMAALIEAIMLNRFEDIAPPEEE
ncbi:MAG: inosine/uridine-preferring nucleoside [Prolixibacteraceae bacterium]|nr:MAG: inosine/uridine-preferring nucleoside [Prolixibacteraceae bacterium]